MARMATSRFSMAWVSVKRRRAGWAEKPCRRILQRRARKVVQAESCDRESACIDSQSVLSAGLRVRTRRRREEGATQGPREAWRDTVGEEKEGESIESINFVVYFDCTDESR